MAGADVVVETSNGAVRGRRQDAVAAFLGIPYAAPPFGADRFAAPRPPDPWTGEREATAFGPTVPAPGYLPPFDAMLPSVHVPGEDCLSVNVWTPDPTPGAGLPVAAWVHGGAFVNGSTAIPTYDGTAFARDGVVCVTLNYRLGVEGYAFFGDGDAENRGLLDQAAALRWVRDEIAAFGGDPARVTVFGESAGAMSIATLLSSPVGRGLCAQAVLQSGAGHHVLPAADAQRVTAAVAEKLGIAATRTAFAQVEAAALLVAQTEVAREVQLTPDPARWGQAAFNAMAFEPVIDGTVVAGRPIDALGDAAIPLLVGTNADEQRLWTVPTGAIDAMSDPAAFAFLADRYGLDPAAAAEAYAAGRAQETVGERASALIGDWFFRAPALRLLEAQAAAGGTGWCYELAWGSPRYDGRLGACHALDLGFVFDTLGRAGTAGLAGDAPPQALADAMHGAWVAFIRDGDPGWPAYDPAGARSTAAFGADGAGVVDDPRPQERAVWEGSR